MKKLLGLLAIAPMAITACGGSGGSGSGGGSSDEKIITAFTYPAYTSEWEKMFTEGDAKNLKTSLENGTNGESFINGAFKVESNQQYAFTNINGQAVAATDFDSAYSAFTTALGSISAANGPSNPTAIPSTWSSMLKTGQVKDSSASYLNDNDPISDANLTVKALGTNTNTIATLPALGGFAGAFGNYMNALNAPIASTSTGTAWTHGTIAKIRYTGQTADKEFSQAASAQTNVNLGTTSSFTAATKYKKPAGASYYIYNEASFNKTLEVKTYGVDPSAVTGITDGNVTDSEAFVTYYIENQNDWAGSASFNGGTMELKVGQFNKDGKLEFEIAKMTIPTYDSKGQAGHNAEATAARTSLFGGLNNSASLATSELAITTQGSSEMDSGFEKGSVFLGTTGDWWVTKNNLAGNLGVMTNSFHLKPAFNSWFTKNLIPNGAVTGEKVYKADFEGTGVHIAMDLDTMYSTACSIVKAQFEAAGETFNPTCPS